MKTEPKLKTVRDPKKKLTEAEIKARQLLKKALKGNVSASIEILNIVYGLPE